MRKSACILLLAVVGILLCPVGATLAQETRFAGVMAKEAARQNYASKNCLENHADCDGTLLPKILEGENADPGQFPWVVSIGDREAIGAAGHECGGTIISDRFVLTAAHCFTDTARPEDYSVQAGTIKLGSYGDKAVIKRILIHPLFDGKTVSFDIALLEMEVPFVAGPTIRWIGLQDEPTFIASGHDIKDRKINYTLTGYGSTGNDGPSSSKLKYSKNIPSLASAICRDLVYWNKPVFGDALRDNMICAGNNTRSSGSDACRGDSGGGLIYYLDPKTPLVAGISSRGSRDDGRFDCTPQSLRVGVYTRVSAYVDAIRACVEGTDHCSFVAPGHQQSASNH